MGASDVGVVGDVVSGAFIFEWMKEIAAVDTNYISKKRRSRILISSYVLCASIFDWISCPDLSLGRALACRG